MQFRPDTYADQPVAAIVPALQSFSDPLNQFRINQNQPLSARYTPLPGAIYTALCSHKKIFLIFFSIYPTSKALKNAKGVYAKKSHTGEGSQACFLES